MLKAGKKAEIIGKIKERGYEILEEKTLKMSQEQARDFYKDQSGQAHFDDLIKYMVSGESCVLALTKPGNKEDVVNQWRQDVGPNDPNEAKKVKPDSLRAQYATDKLMNALHSSDTRESAMRQVLICLYSINTHLKMFIGDFETLLRELAFFFPNPDDQHETRRLGSGAHGGDQAGSNQAASHRAKSAKGHHKQQRTLALIRPSAFAQHQTAILQRIKDKGFHIAMHKTVHFDRAQAEDFYADQRSKPFFEDLVTEMSSGPMLVVCLVKEDAVQAWRDMLGPKEKDQVKQAAGT